MKKVILLIMVVVLISQASAQYIIGDIYLDEIGNARFDVESDTSLEIKGLSFLDNRITGETAELTNKQGVFWSFILNLGNYEDMLLDIHLPKNLKSIQSIQGVDSVIDIDNRMISLIDSNKELFFKVDYDLQDSRNYTLFYFLVVVLLISAAIYYFFKIKNDKKKLDSIFPLINENEQRILELLMKKSMRQRQVREILKIPKASFTRYMINLEKKKLIVREGEGKNRVLRVQ